jgi:hypothetical protein
VRPDFEVLTMRRVGVDVHPAQVGVGPEDVASFRKFPSGRPYVTRSVEAAFTFPTSA